MTIRRKRTHRLRDMVTGDRVLARQQDDDIARQIDRPRRASPHTNRRREAERPLCPVCRRIKVYTDLHGHQPTCIPCYQALGCPQPAAWAKIAQEAEEKHKRRKADLEGPRPW